MKTRILTLGIGTAALLASSQILAQNAPSSVYDYDWGQRQATSSTSYDWGQSQVNSWHYGTSGAGNQRKIRPSALAGAHADSDQNANSTLDETKLKGGPDAYGGMNTAKPSLLPDQHSLLKSGQGSLR
jgi:hypothetical protein